MVNSQNILFRMEKLSCSRRKASSLFPDSCWLDALAGGGGDRNNPPVIPFSRCCWWVLVPNQCKAGVMMFLLPFHIDPFCFARSELWRLPGCGLCGFEKQSSPHLFRILGSMHCLHCLVWTDSAGIKGLKVSDGQTLSPQSSSLSLCALCLS